MRDLDHQAYQVRYLGLKVPKYRNPFNPNVDTTTTWAQYLPRPESTDYRVLKGGWFKGGGYKGSLGNLKNLKRTVGSTREN